MRLQPTVFKSGRQVADAPQKETKKTKSKSGLDLAEGKSPAEMSAEEFDAHLEEVSPEAKTKTRDPFGMEQAARGKLAPRSKIKEQEQEQDQEQDLARRREGMLLEITASGESRRVVMVKVEAKAKPGVGKLMMVERKRLRESAHNPRKEFGGESMAELVESVKAQGIQTPLIVRRIKIKYQEQDQEQEQEFEILAGHRRYRASEPAGLTELPCLVKELDDQQALEILLLDNLQRQGLSALEEGEGFRDAIDSGQFTAESLAERIGKSRRHVFNRLALVRLPAEVKEALRAGKIDQSKALVIGRVQDENRRAELLEDALPDDDNHYDGMSVRDLEHEIGEDKTCERDLKEAPWEMSYVFPNEIFRVARGQRPDVCAGCPMRMANRPEFDPVKDKDRADVCTEPKCYASKEGSWGQVIAARCAADGVQWFGKKAALFNQWDGYKLKDSHDYPKQREFVAPHWTPEGSKKTWQQLFAEKPKIEWLGKVADGRWKLHQVIPAAIALARAKELGLTRVVGELSPEKKSRTSSGSIDYKARERERKAKLAPMEAAVKKAKPLVIAAARMAGPKKEWLGPVIAALSEDMYGGPDAKKLKGLDAGGMFAELVTMAIRDPVSYDGEIGKEFSELCAVAKVDLDGLLKAEQESGSQKATKTKKK